MINNKPPIRCGMNSARNNKKCITFSRTTFTSSLSKTAFGLSCPAIFVEFVRCVLRKKTMQPSDTKKGELTNRGKDLNTKEVRETSVFNFAYHS